VRKHILTKHTALVEDVRAKALDDVYADNYVRHAEAAEAGGAAVRPQGAERDARPRFKAQQQQQQQQRFDGDGGAQRGPRRPRDGHGGGGGGGGYASYGGGGGGGGGGPHMMLGASAVTTQIFVPAPGAGWAGPFLPVTLGAGGVMGSPPGAPSGGGGGGMTSFLPGGVPSAAYVDLDAHTHASARPVLDYGDL
jgi:hypothetical protein